MLFEFILVVCVLRLDWLNVWLMFLDFVFYCYCGCFLFVVFDLICDCAYCVELVVLFRCILCFLERVCWFSILCCLAWCLFWFEFVGDWFTELFVISFAWRRVLTLRRLCCVYCDLIYLMFTVGVWDWLIVYYFNRLDYVSIIVAFVIRCYCCFCDFIYVLAW